MIKQYRLRENVSSIYMFDKDLIYRILQVNKNVNKSTKTQQMDKPQKKIYQWLNNNTKNVFKTISHQ